MLLYKLPASNFVSLVGTPQNPTPKKDIWIVAQAPDCSSFLLLSNTPYPAFEPFTTYEGYDFTYCQEWGLTINDEVVERVKNDIRAKSYPSVAEQLDTIYHYGLNVWQLEIQAIKLALPK